MIKRENNQSTRIRPKENVEYTFIFGENKIYVFVLDYRLPNGRYRFRCRTANGKGSAWFTDMDEKRFSYVHRFNRDVNKYPDKPVDVLPEVKSVEDVINDNAASAALKQKQADDIRVRKTIAALRSLSDGQKAIAKKYNIRVNDVIEAIAGNTSVYDNSLVGTLALKRDVEALSDLFAVDIRLT